MCAMRVEAPMTSADRWLEDEILALRSAHPVGARVGRWLVAQRVPIIVVLCAVLAAVMDAMISSDNDMPTFVQAGHVLASRHGLDVFSDPSVQVGALALLLTEVFGRLGSLVRLPDAVGATAGLAALATYGALRVSAAARPLPERLAVLRDLGVGAAIALGPILTAALFGQLGEVLVAVGLVAAGQLALRGRDVAAGGVLGLCVALKLWGVLGLPLLLFAFTPRAVLRRAIACAVVVAVAYSPFVLLGEFKTFSYRWLISPQTPLGHVDAGGVFDWRLRALQAAIVCIGALLLLRRPGAEPWLVVAGIVVLRLLTDPARHTYYETALVAVLVIGLWPRYARRWMWATPMLVVGALITTVGDYLITGPVDDLLRYVGIGLALLAVVVLSGRPVPSAEPAVASQA